MWKWTDPDAIKALIIDIDSVKSEYQSIDFKTLMPQAELFLVKDVLSDIKMDAIKYYDVSNLVLEVLVRAKCESYSVIAISKDPLFLKEMMQNHIGTIFVGDFKKNLLKYSPDFIIPSISSLAKILTGERIGYAAEAKAIYGTCNKNTLSLLKCESEVILNNEIKKVVTLYFGGRYYSYDNQYLQNDPLSYIVMNFKNKYIPIVDAFFDLAISFINKKEHIDILTYVPMKPMDILTNRFNRFTSLELREVKQGGVQLQNIINCNKDFSQKGNDLHMRREIVKGAFYVSENVVGKDVMIIDDVVASGSTVLEIAKTLYEQGANKVIVIALAANQLTESSLVYKSLTCDYCDSPVVLRLNKKKNTLFFGCRNYRSHSENYSLDVPSGLNLLKRKNKLEIKNIVDLDDEY